MEYRSIFTGCIAVGWQTYLSYINKQAELLEAQKTGLEQGNAVVKVEEVKVKGVKLDDVKLVAVEAQAA